MRNGLAVSLTELQPVSAKEWGMSLIQRTVVGGGVGCWRGRDRGVQNSFRRSD